MPLKGPREATRTLYVIFVAIAVPVLSHVVTGSWMAWSVLLVSLTMGPYLLLLGITDWSGVGPFRPWKNRGIFGRTVLVLAGMFLIVASLMAVREDLQERRARETETAPTLGDGHLTP